MDGDKWSAVVTGSSGPLYPHVGYCISTRAKQTGGGAVVEEEEEEVRGEEGGKERGGGAPISPDASLADGLL